jgi:hypothetical protein
MAKGTHHGLNEQSKAVKHRREDAQVLLEGGRWRGAMYMAGYSVECLLKVKLMQMFRRRNLVDLEAELQRRGILIGDRTVFTHHLRPLLVLTGAAERLRQNTPLWRQFSDVNAWLPAWRYSANVATPREAKEFVDAVDAVLIMWIRNNV